MEKNDGLLSQPCAEGTTAFLTETPAPSAAWPDTACCMGTMHSDGCACGPEERALRGWIAGRSTQPMTAAQREYCFAEIERVEGYTRAEYEGADDALLARGVLDAWTDYCRDKGLL